MSWAGVAIVHAVVTGVSAGIYMESIPFGSAVLTALLFVQAVVMSVVGR